MKNTIILIAGVWLCLILSAGCGSKSGRSLIDLDAKLNSESYVRKYDNFMIILDSSGSMKEKMGGQSKADYSKALLKRINDMMPNIKMTGALRTYGHSVSISEKGVSDLVYWPVKYQKDKFEKAIDEIKWASGLTGADVALDESIQDIEPLEGKTSVIIVSDGKLDKEITFQAAEKIKRRFGDTLCLYTVHIESETDDVRQNKIDRKLMNGIAEIGQCGFCVSSKQLETKIQVAEFIEKVFMDTDSDMDGVGDAEDRCPNTENNVLVDNSGCPARPRPDELAAARSGKDKIEPDQEPDQEKEAAVESAIPEPQTESAPEPESSGRIAETDAEIEEYGLETEVEYSPEFESVLFEAILFSNGASAIHPRLYPRLNAIASEMKLHPEMKLLVTGHSDPTETDNPETLSRLRAEAVGSYLIDRGIHTERLDIKGLGDDSPRNSNLSPVGRADNRRVELYIIK